MWQAWRGRSCLDSRRWPCPNPWFVGWPAQEVDGRTCCQGLKSVTNALEQVDGNMERSRRGFKIESISSKYEVRGKELAFAPPKVETDSG